MDPEVALEPAEPVPVDGVLPPGIQIGNGRVVDGTCTTVCSDASTDPDAQGATDGWGYERERSCLVPDSDLELEGELCDIPELAPMPVLPPEIPAGNTPRPAGNLSTGFFVSGGRLFDRLGADFVMRGINHPVAWFQNDALTWLDEIATTGSNSVRLVWQTTGGSTQVIRASIEHSVELGMIPMVELHDVTGSSDVNGPAQMAQYYVDEMRDILLEFEPYLLVNIANEWGPYQSTDDAWVQAYRQAISVLRDAGLHHTLVIDANDYGQRGNTIVTRAQELLDFDPQHNLLFSTHMYQAYENPQTILDVLRGAQMRSLPIIVGEFGFQHGNRNGQPIPVPYTTMVDEAARLGLGYLAWSWTGNSGGVEYLDLSENGSASQLTGWGDDIINGMNGIRATAVPASVFSVP
jgi:mannan endo-1,4-beta-mannosidase